MATLTMTVNHFSSTSWPPDEGVTLHGSTPPYTIAVMPYEPVGNNVIGTVAHGSSSATLYMGNQPYGTLVDQLASPQTLTVTITYTPATPPTPQVVTDFEGTLS